MSKKVLKLAGRRSMVLALIMATFTFGLLFWGRLSTVFAQQNSGNGNGQVECPSLNNTPGVNPSDIASCLCGKLPKPNVLKPTYAPGKDKSGNPITYIVGDVNWDPDPDSFTTDGDHPSTAWVNVTSSDPSDCPNLGRVNIGTCTWHIYTASVSGPASRIPIYGGPNPIQGSATVTLNPSPLPTGETVTVSIGTIRGDGSATFDDGSTSKTITQTTTFNIRRKANSNHKDNIQLTACSSTSLFTVSTWPNNMYCTLASTNNNYGLTVTPFFESESGNQSDLGNVICQEQLVYGSISNPPFSIPPNHTTLPVSGTTKYYPGSGDIPIWGTNPEGFIDRHGLDPKLLCRNLLISGASVRG
jgi:hypothetical protein